MNSQSLSARNFMQRFSLALLYSFMGTFSEAVTKRNLAHVVGWINIVFG